MSSNTAQLTSHSLSQLCPSQVYTPVLLPTVTFLQNKTPKMTWQNPCCHSRFWCCKDDYLGSSGFKWKKKKASKRWLHAQKQMFWKRARERFCSPRNANNIYHQMSRILSKCYSGFPAGTHCPSPTSIQSTRAVFFKKKQNLLSTGRLVRRQSQAPVAEAAEADPQVPWRSHQPSKLHSVHEPGSLRSATAEQEHTGKPCLLPFAIFTVCPNPAWLTQTHDCLWRNTEDLSETWWMYQEQILYQLQEKGTSNCLWGI